jgi:hypothetical protein
VVTLTRMPSASPITPPTTTNNHVRLAMPSILASKEVGVNATLALQPMTGTFPIPVHATFPSGTFCSFAIRIDLDGTGRFSVFDNPPRNIQHYEQQGTITANGKTLLVDNHSNVTTTPPSNPSEELGVFTQRGAPFHILVPGGGIVLLDAGYLVTLFPSGTVVVSHGHFPFEVDGDVSAVCAALAP